MGKAVLALVAVLARGWSCDGRITIALAHFDVCHSFYEALDAIDALTLGCFPTNGTCQFGSGS